MNELCNPSLQQNPIDWVECVKKFSGNELLAKELLHQLIEELHRNKVEFIDLMQQKNQKRLHEAAHKLNGACCFFEVPYLRASAIELEKRTQNNTDFDALSEPFTKLMANIDAVIEAYTLLQSIS